MRAHVGCIRGILTTHHKLMSDVRSILKSMAKVVYYVLFLLPFLYCEGSLTIDYLLSFLYCEGSLTIDYLLPFLYCEGSLTIDYLLPLLYCLWVIVRLSYKLAFRNFRF